MTSTTKYFGLGFLICASLMAVALFMQYQMELEPCPLCLMQRMAFIAIGLVCLVGLVLNFSWVRKFCAGLMSLFALAGFGLAARQLWLQSLPEDQVPVCGPGFDYMINNFPLSKALTLVLSGSGECAEVQWTFLGISIPGWSLLFFIGFVLLGLYLLFARRFRTV